MALSGTASAADLPALSKTQQVIAKVCGLSSKTTADFQNDGYKRDCPTAKGNAYGQIDAYLSTRYSNSPNVTGLGNPVGKVVMKFPTGSFITPGNSGKPNCDQPARNGADVITKCADSLIGSGWALVNTGQWLGEGGTPLPRAQLDGAPAPCATQNPDLSWTVKPDEYTRTFEADGTLPCVPAGDLWNKVRVYQGGKPYDVANNRPGTAVDPNSVIFVSQNVASIVAFDGQIVGNTLTVNLPALYGTGSYPGELFFGWQLKDFRVVLNQLNYLRLGSCPVSNQVTTTSTISYSKTKNLDGIPNVSPAPVPWIGTSAYAKDQVVSFGGKYYKASPAAIAALVAPAWSKTKTYAKNKIVSYLGKFYKASKSISKNKVPGTSANGWVEILRAPTATGSGWVEVPVTEDNRAAPSDEIKSETVPCTS